jgi:hypothetical protein
MMTDDELKTIESDWLQMRRSNYQPGVTIQMANRVPALIDEIRRLQAELKEKEA